MTSTLFTKATSVRDRLMKVITRHFIRVWIMALSVLTVSDSNAQERDEPLKPQYEKLLNQLGDDSFQVRERATQELIELGSRARIEVIAASDSPDLEIRTRASRIIKTWTTDKLVRLLGDDSMMVRQKATDALLQRGPTVRAEMATALDGADAEIRSQAQRIYEEWSLTEYLLENPNEIDFLNPKQAAEIVSRYPDQLSLPNVTFFFKGRVVARELAGHRGALALDGLKSIDEDTARELLRFEGSSLSLNGLTTIDSGVARELLKFEGSLSLQGLASIFGDVTQALEMIAGSGSPDAEIRSRARRTYQELPLTEYLLNTPSKIVSLNARQAAQVVAKHPSLLFLPKLTVLDYLDPAKDKNVARELAKHKGALSLGGLEFIDVDVARELANMKGRLSLGGLKSINKYSAQELANATAKSLQFDGLKSLDSKAAQELAKFKGEFLGLDGLESIDKDVARELAKFEGKILYLQGLKSIDKGTAQGLASFKGDLLDNPSAKVCLRLEGLVTINQDVARELAKFEGTYLALNGLKFIDKIVASEMVSFRGHIDLQGLKSIDKDVAQELAKFEGKLLDLDGLESISKDVARELVSVKGHLGLGALKSIDREVAKELARREGEMGFGYALKSIDKEVARELAKWKGKYLNLQSVESMDKETAQELVKFEGVRLILTGLGFIDKDTLEILKSNPAILLPSK